MQWWHALLQFQVLGEGLLRAGEWLQLHCERWIMPLRVKQGSDQRHQLLPRVKLRQPDQAGSECSSSVSVRWRYSSSALLKRCREPQLLLNPHQPRRAYGGLWRLKERMEGQELMGHWLGSQRILLDRPGSQHLRYPELRVLPNRLITYFSSLLFLINFNGTESKTAFLNRELKISHPERSRLNHRLHHPSKYQPRWRFLRLVCNWFSRWYVSPLHWFHSCLVIQLQDL